MSSSKDSQTEEETNQQHSYETIKHPSFTIQKVEDLITTIVTLSTHQSIKLDEFYILHR